MVSLDIVDVCLPHLDRIWARRDAVSRIVLRAVAASEPPLLAEEGEGVGLQQGKYWAGAAASFSVAGVGEKKRMGGGGGGEGGGDAWLPHAGGPEGPLSRYFSLNPRRSAIPARLSEVELLKGSTEGSN